MTNEVIQIAVPGEIMEASRLLLAGGATAAALKWKSIFEMGRRAFGKKYSVHLCARIDELQRRVETLEMKGGT